VNIGSSDVFAEGSEHSSPQNFVWNEEPAHDGANVGRFTAITRSESQHSNPQNTVWRVSQSQERARDGANVGHASAPTQWSPYGGPQNAAQFGAPNQQQLPMSMHGARPVALLQDPQFGNDQDFHFSASFGKQFSNDVDMISTSESAIPPREYQQYNIHNAFQPGAYGQELSPNGMVRARPVAQLQEPGQSFVYNDDQSGTFGRESFPPNNPRSRSVAPFRERPLPYANNANQFSTIGQESLTSRSRSAGPRHKRLCVSEEDSRLPARASCTEVLYHLDVSRPTPSVPAAASSVDFNVTRNQVLPQSVSSTRFLNTGAPTIGNGMNFSDSVEACFSQSEGTTVSCRSAESAALTWNQQSGEPFQQTQLNQSIVPPLMGYDFQKPGRVDFNDSPYQMPASSGHVSELSDKARSTGFGRTAREIKTGIQTGPDEVTVNNWSRRVQHTSASDFGPPGAGNNRGYGNQRGPQRDQQGHGRRRQNERNSGWTRDRQRSGW